MANPSDDSDELSQPGGETLLPSLTLSVLGGVSVDDSLVPLPPGMTPPPRRPPTAEPLPLPLPAPPTPPAGTPAVPLLRRSTDPKPAPAGGDDPRRGARAGDVIGGRYVVDGQLGRGGMGRVLRVRHQVLGKAFALKVIKAPIATDPRIREMFYREARLASALTHDNICSIVDFGQDPSFGLFMVMELLDGSTVHHKLRHGGRIAPKVACDIMWQVCEAVRYIHGRAILHGDIKTENIFLVRSPERRRTIRLLDFGLARPDLGKGAGSVDGTPEYMAPERIRGGPATTASDIYALGVVFFELLTGRPPWSGAVDEIFRHQLDDPMPAPSKIIDEPLDERADEIVLRATAKNPADRHPDVSALMYELRTLMNMLGMDVGRRRSATGDARERRDVDHRGKAAAEVFTHAPLPMAACDPGGKVRVANRAFLDFLGAAGDAGGIELRDSGLADVYPTLLEDLDAVASRRQSLKRIIYLSEGGGAVVEAAIVLTPAPTSTEVTAGEVFILLHPLRHVPAGGG
jgi:tRNA A-37 threonylcarbamoyl transferase component Bud32